MNSQRWLVWVLRVEGVVMLLALGAVFAPDRWLEVGHVQAGLGEYPASRTTEYLARSLSLLYAGVGLLVLVISFDVDHYRRLILYMGVGHLVFVPLLLYVDVQCGMPLSWTITETVGALIVGVVILALVKRGN